MLNGPKHSSNTVHSYHIHSVFWKKLSWKKSLLVRCKILGLFVITFTTNYKYSPLNRDNLTQPIQMQVSKEKKRFSQFFPAFLKSLSNFEHFEKNRWPSKLTYFRYYGLRKPWLEPSVKSPVYKTLRQATCKTVPNTTEIFTADPFL